MSCTEITANKYLKKWMIGIQTPGLTVRSLAVVHYEVVFFHVYQRAHAGAQPPEPSLDMVVEPPRALSFREMEAKVAEKPGLVNGAGVRRLWLGLELVSEETGVCTASRSG